MRLLIANGAKITEVALKHGAEKGDFIERKLKSCKIFIEANQDEKLKKLIKKNHDPFYTFILFSEIINKIITLEEQFTPNATILFKLYKQMKSPDKLTKEQKET